jgi:hypothetical protein
MDRERSRRIGWMINGMTKAGLTTAALLGIERPSERVGHKMFDLVLHPQRIRYQSASLLVCGQAQ